MDTYIPLDTIRIASPCSTSWDAMQGDDRVRHCSECSLSVYNISEMTREAAEKLVSNAEGRLCIRMYQRADGTIITQDCPVGLQALRVRVVRKVRTMTAAALTFIGSAVGLSSAQGGAGEIMGKMVPVEVEAPADTVVQRDTVDHTIMMGGMMAPVDPPTAPEPADQPADEPEIYEVMGEMVAVPPADTTETFVLQCEPNDQGSRVDQPLPHVEPVALEPGIR